MARFELVVMRDGQRVDTFVVEKEHTVVGRSPDADLLLDDQTVSRRHARIIEDMGRLSIEDLGSRNGFTVNGTTADQAPLTDGDVIAIGLFTLHVRATALSDSSKRITYSEATALYESIVADAAPARLPVLYQAAQLLGTVFDIDELLDRILALIFDALPVQRGYVLLVSASGREPEIRASRTRSRQASDLPVSETVVTHVFAREEAVLTFDAQTDARFAGADSVSMHAIHAAMCVPLCGRMSIIGALYVDSGAESGLFSDDDLELLTAIGRVVGVAIENAWLYRENLEKERLSAIGLAMAGVGHSVKNILTGVKAGGEIVDAALKERDIDPLERGWGILRRSIDRMEVLVLNLLTLSKDRAPQRMPVALNDVVADAVEVLRPNAEKSGVTLTFQRGEGEPAFAEGPAIHRVVLNLVLNAIEACEDSGGTVAVRYTLAGDDHVIEVRDTGPGIAPEAMPALFEVFGSTKGSRGTGLGLPSCDKIVREHGGRIEVDSTPGAGATFRVFLTRLEVSETGRPDSARN